MTPYKLTHKAWADYFAAYDFIEAYSPRAAERWEPIMLNAFQIIARFPETGTLRPEYAAEPYRFWFVEDYAILYDSGTRPVQVLGIFHGAQDLHPIIARRVDV